jgi:hypothetical protein
LGCVVVGLEDSGADVFGLGLSHFWVLGPEYVNDWPSSLCAQGIRFQDAAALTTCEIADGRTEASRIDPGIEGPGFGVVVWRAVPHGLVVDLGLGVINKSGMEPPIPKVHPIRQPTADVFGTTNPWCRLKDDRDEHQGALGIPGAVAYSFEFLSEGFDESSPNFAFGGIVVGRRDLGHSFPAPLPYGVIIDASVQVASIVRVRMVAKYGVKERVCLGEDVFRQVGPRVGRDGLRGRLGWWFLGRIILSRRRWLLSFRGCRGGLLRKI